MNPQQTIFVACFNSLGIDLDGKPQLATESTVLNLHRQNLAAATFGIFVIASRHLRLANTSDANRQRQDFDLNIAFVDSG